jgi:hypothetical protein
LIFRSDVLLNMSAETAFKKREAIKRVCARRRSRQVFGNCGEPAAADETSLRAAWVTAVVMAPNLLLATLDSTIRRRLIMFADVDCESPRPRAPSTEAKTVPGTEGDLINARSRRGAFRT